MSPETVKSILNNIISELHQDPSLFVARPGIDFTRDRKLPLDTMLKIIIGMNGGSIKRELYDCYEVYQCFLRSVCTTA